MLVQTSTPQHHLMETLLSKQQLRTATLNWFRFFLMLVQTSTSQHQFMKALLSKQQLRTARLNWF